GLALANTLLSPTVRSGNRGRPRGRMIKSTTIPLFDGRLGLFGFVCMNIDISRVKSDKLDEGTRAFLQAFRTTREPPVPIKEIIENTRQQSPPGNSANQSPSGDEK